MNIANEIGKHMNAAIDAAKPKLVIPNTGDIDYTSERPLFFLHEAEDDGITIQDCAADELLFLGRGMTAFAVAHQNESELAKLPTTYDLAVCKFNHTVTEKHGDYFIAFYERA
jgi:hypothetical protein